VCEPSTVLDETLVESIFTMLGDILRVHYSLTGPKIVCFLTQCAVDIAGVYYVK